MMMVSQWGHVVLLLYFLIAFISFIVGFFGLKYYGSAFPKFLIRSSQLQWGLITLSICCLFYAFLSSDFALKIVYQNSHLQKPWIYKLTALWANHEGSMMLWVWILSFYHLFVGCQSFPSKAQALMCFSALAAGFSGFILFTSNPFEYVVPIPLNGLGLNPLLQDPGLAYHPPFLYLGYVGYSAVAALIVGAMFKADYGHGWFLCLSRLAYLAFTSLTIGITMGSFWAYYELGWGGFWFWDPVENVALLPWLFGLVMVHMLRLYEQKKYGLNGLVLSGIFAFIFSLVGTFIVRSGVLVSIHSFVSDPSRGIVILSLISVYTIAAILTYALKFKVSTQHPVTGFFTRANYIRLNACLVSLIAFVVIFGTLYPLVHEAIYGDTISVGAPYFNKMIVPLCFILMFFMIMVHYLTWQKMPKRHVIIFILLGFVLSLILLPFQLSLFAFLGCLLSLWLIGSILLDIKADRLRHPRFYTYIIGHLGFAIFIFAVSISTNFSKQVTVKAMTGETFNFSGYHVLLRDMQQFEKDNYVSQQATLSLKADGKSTIILRPERRIYFPSMMNLAETSIQMSLLKNLYAALLPVDQTGAGGASDIWLLTIHEQPFVVWIWIGGLVIAASSGFGLYLSIFKKRKR